MTRDYIFDNLKTIFKQIKPNLDTETLSPDTRLVEDLGLDSLTTLLMSFAIEKNFQIKFEGSQKFINIDQVIDYIEENVR